MASQGLTNDFQLVSGDFRDVSEGLKDLHGCFRRSHGVSRGVPVVFLRVSGSFWESQWLAGTVQRFKRCLRKAQLVSGAFEGVSGVFQTVSRSFSKFQGSQGFLERITRFSGAYQGF